MYFRHTNVYTIQRRQHNGPNAGGEYFSTVTQAYFSLIKQIHIPQINNDFAIKSKYHQNFVSYFLNNSNLEFTRCLYSEFVLSYITSNFNTDFLRF